MPVGFVWEISIWIREWHGFCFPKGCFCIYKFSAFLLRPLPLCHYVSLFCKAASRLNSRMTSWRALITSRSSIPPKLLDLLHSRRERHRARACVCLIQYSEWKRFHTELGIRDTERGDTVYCFPSRRLFGSLRRHKCWGLFTRLVVIGIV